MTTNTTPKHIRQTYTDVIDRLNSRWDLELSRQPGRQPESSSFETPEARRCASQIRYLSFRPQHGSLEKVIEDFEEFAKTSYSQWVAKPSQERGTIVSLPKSRSLLFRDSVSHPRTAGSRTAGAKLTTQHRKQLLDYLSKSLNDECQLVQSSDAYQRQSAPPSNSPSFIMPATETRTSASTYSKPILGVTVLEVGKEKEKKSAKPERTVRSRKRTHSLIYDETDVPLKKIPRASTIDNFFTISGPVSGESKSVAMKNFLPPSIETSFKSSGTPEPAKIFTPSLDGNTWSNDTSMLSIEEANEEETQYPFSCPTQEMLQFCEHPSVRDSFSDPSSTPDQRFLFDLLNSGPMRSAKSRLPHALRLGFRYELHRVARIFDIDILKLYHAVMKICQTSEPSHDDFWQAVHQTANECNKKMPERSTPQGWDSAQDTAKCCNTPYALALSGHLKWSDASTPGLFTLRLNPLKIDKTCRFHRKFGADRFIVLTMPAFTPGQIPRDSRDLHKHLTALHQQISSWLGASIQHIVGREWRVFYIEDDKSQNKKKRLEDGPQIKIHLFALSGADFMSTVGASEPSDLQIGHQPLSIQNFIDWHLPLGENMESTDLKSFARFALGLSKTTSTVVLETHEFLQVKETTPVMDDGCALMSFKLAQAVAKVLGLDTKQLPSAFQGRIGGAKGLWIVDYHNRYPETSRRDFWIEVTNSQLKIKPHPANRPDADPHLRTFEVLKYSTTPKTAHLNIQLINILDDRKVPRTLLRELLLADAGAYSDELLSSMEDTRELGLWVQKYHRSLQGSTGDNMLGAFPKSREEQITLLLESGFEPKECLTLNEKLGACLSDELTRYVERLQIKVPHSTFVYCVADPCGVLEPGEVHFGATDQLENPLTERWDNNLQDVDLLVARVPAYLPSDIQKRRVVYKEQLRGLRNVIVFPTKGEVPLASLLSGGDYDGDIVWVCWNSAIVNSFKETPLPKNLPSDEECGLEQKSRRMTSVFHLQSEPGPNVDDFLTGCAAFNIEPSLLGTCTHEHEKLIYHQKNKSMSTPSALKLAALAGFLVDAPKQGHFLSRDAWYKLRMELSGKKALTPPAYKGSEPPRTMRLRKDGACDNVVDWLKFDIARVAKENILDAFHRKWPRTPYYDKALSRLWNQARETAENETRKARDSSLKRILDHVETQVKAVKDTWALNVDRSVKGTRGTELNLTDRNFNLRIQSAYDAMMLIKPPAAVEHELVRRYEAEKEQTHSYWSSLRASCAYYHFKEGLMVWYTVGEELCRMKAESVGPTRVVISSIHKLMKMDCRRLKAIAGASGEPDLREEEHLAAEDVSDLTLDDWILER